jgi:dephospho-CoA kinase
MLKVGITGGIGAGKTTVAKYFEKLGIPVYYYDDAVKNLYDTNTELKQTIQKHFGEDVYVEDKLNRKKFASILFSNANKLQLLNELLHPFVEKDKEEWMSKQNAPYALFETAILFEAKIDKDMDYIIGVTASDNIRLKRAMARDNATAEQVLARMAKQMPDWDKMKLCNSVIFNDLSGVAYVEAARLHKKLIELATSKNKQNVHISNVPIS